MGSVFRIYLGGDFSDIPPLEECTYSLLLITFKIGWVLCVGIFSNTAGVTEKIALLETLAVRTAYRSVAAASPNLFYLWQKRVLIRITLSHQN